MNAVVTVTANGSNIFINDNQVQVNDGQGVQGEGGKWFTLVMQTLFIYTL